MSRARTSPRQLLAWAVYDWASSPYFAVILTFVFAAYFTQGVAANPIDGTAQWGLAMSISALLIACRPSVSDDEVARAVIGPDGGTIASLDAVLTIAILPGALEEEVEMFIEPTREPPVV